MAAALATSAYVHQQQRRSISLPTQHHAMGCVALARAAGVPCGRCEGRGRINARRAGCTVHWFLFFFFSCLPAALRRSAPSLARVVLTLLPPLRALEPRPSNKQKPRDASRQCTARSTLPLECVVFAYFFFFMCGSRLCLCDKQVSATGSTKSKKKIREEKDRDTCQQSRSGNPARREKEKKLYIYIYIHAHARVPRKMRLYGCT